MKVQIKRIENKNGSLKLIFYLIINKYKTVKKDIKFIKMTE